MLSMRETFSPNVFDKRNIWLMLQSIAHKHGKATGFQTFPTSFPCFFLSFFLIVPSQVSPHSVFLGFLHAILEESLLALFFKTTVLHTGSHSRLCIGSVVMNFFLGSSPARLVWNYLMPAYLLNKQRCVKCYKAQENITWSTIQWLKCKECIKKSKGKKLE